MANLKVTMVDAGIGQLQIEGEAATVVELVHEWQARQDRLRSEAVRQQETERVTGRVLPFPPRPS